MNTIKKISFLLFASFVLFLIDRPNLVGALPSGGPEGDAILDGGAKDLGGVFDIISYILSRTIVIIMGFAVVVFLWGVFTYIVSKSPEEQSKGKGYMIWGIIGLFVMVSVWALVELLTGTLFGDDIQNKPPAIPTL